MHRLHFAFDVFCQAHMILRQKYIFTNRLFYNISTSNLDDDLGSC